MDARPITEPQQDYVRALCKKLSLPERLLDDHTIKTFGKRWRQLTVSEGRQLLDEMIGWQRLPVEFERAKGQTTMPGFG